MTRIPVPSRLTRLSFVAYFTAMLLLTFVGQAEAIPPPELARIGSVFVQSLAMALVFLTPTLFFLWKQINRLLTAIQSKRRVLTLFTTVILLILAVWAGSALYVVTHNNRTILAAASPAEGAAVIGGDVMSVAGMQFDITDLSLAISPRETEKLLGSTTHLFIDIREPVEFATRHIPGFINIRVGDMMAGGEFRQLDKARSIILVCEAGERGSAIASFLRLKGYQAFYVDKGIRGWIEQKLPFSGSARMQLPDFPDKYTKFSPTEAKELLITGESVLVDVRSPAEFGKGHLEGAVNIPLVNLTSSALELAIDQMPRDKHALGIAYDRFGAYYCLIFGNLLDQQKRKYGGTLMMPPAEQGL